MGYVVAFVVGLLCGAAGAALFIWYSQGGPVWD